MGNQKITDGTALTELANDDVFEIIDASEALAADQNKKVTATFLAANIHKLSFLNYGGGTELTIATGVVTATSSFHSIDTNNDDASDDLDTINGGADGDFLLLRAANSGRTVVCKDGTGNLSLAGDFSMDNASDRILLAFRAQWREVSRSNNQ